MLSIRDHGVEDYVELLDMDATDVGQLDEDDRACLDELGRYLIATQAWQRFAVWLLHKHFEPNTGEVFVERGVMSPPQTYTRAIDRTAFPTGGLNPTALRFDSEGGSEVSVIGMEFATPADFGSTAPVNPADEAVLSGLRERLHARGKTDRFGVQLIRDHLRLPAEHIWSETCSLTERFLYCRAVDTRREDTSSSVETTWRWEPVYSADGRVVMDKCTKSCMRSCTVVGGSPRHVHDHTPSHEPQWD